MLDKLKHSGLSNTHARMAPTTKAKGKRKAAVMPSMFAPLEKMKAPTLLKAARLRADKLNEALAKLKWQTEQYREQKYRSSRPNAELARSERRALSTHRADTLGLALL